MLESIHKVNFADGYRMNYNRTYQSFLGFFSRSNAPLLVLIFCILSLQSTGQSSGRTKIELLNADVSEFNQRVNADATRLLGNVRFRHESALLYCDSAYLFRSENKLEAFGRIRITQGDSLVLTGGKLDYDGNTRIAQVYRNIVMTDRRMRLNTQRISYDLSASTASFTDSAHIVDGENTLTSKSGYYLSNSGDLYFKRNVILVNPKYVLTCDTLRYNTIQKTAYFLGPTNIRTSDSRMYCEGGWYNTSTQRSLFTGSPFLESGGQLLRGDSVAYDQLKGIGRATRHVSIFDSTRQLIIRGNFAEYHQLTDSAWVTDAAEMVQYDEHDSLFLHADTLMAIGKKSAENQAAREQKDIFAWHHVKLFKSDLQGTCDSLVYTYSDSTIRFFRKPILWSGYNQLTADSISLVTGENRLLRIHLRLNAFIVSKSDTLQEGPIDSLHFNQITGKNMTGYFRDNQLERIDVNGNVQTIYYAKNSKDKDAGVNRADCSDMRIRIKKNVVQKITFIKDPDGTLYPLRELKTSELRLKGFRWEQEKRPADRAAIFK